LYTIQQIANTLQAEAHIVQATTPIRFLSVDSRKISFPDSTLFFALSTTRRDGHSFVSELYENDVRNFVVRKDFDISPFSGCNFIFADDAGKALQQLAAAHRSRFNIPVVAITGSNGKTIVKEWIYQALSAEQKVTRSPRSFNSQIGVPLSVWLIDNKTELAIFEAGISEPGEMENLASIIQPTIGVITNIGAAHDAFFTNRQQKTHEKFKLFGQCSYLIAPADDPYISQEKLPDACKLMSWGTTKNATIYITALEKKNYETIIFTLIAGQPYRYSLPFTDDASIQNACTLITLLYTFGILPEQINARLAQLCPVDLRLQMIPGIHQCLLLNDSYSLDTTSLSIALNFLVQQTGLSKTVILSDIPNGNEQDYIEIINTLIAGKINRLISIGTEWKKYIEVKHGFSHINFSTTHHFIQQIHQLYFSKEAILIKGGRKYGFETIVHQLEKKVHQTILEINLTALIHNLNELRTCVQKKVKIMAMVKASGYGSGSIETALALQYHKVDYLAVAYADEGAELRQAGVRLPIMVLNVDPAAFETIVQHNLEPEIYSFPIFKAWHNFLSKEGISHYPVHIKVDTGMHRLGFLPDEMNSLITALNNQQSVVVKSVFSHLASSGDKNEDAFTLSQATLFQNICHQLEEGLRYTFIKHLANSAAATRLPALQYDMVRVGIGLFGIHSSENTCIHLQPVISLKTTIAQIKRLPAGSTVGYNRLGLLKRDSIIATLRVGYADGYRRQLGHGKGRFFINGYYAPVVGTVAMDMLMVDITDIPSVKEGDMAEAFGNYIPVEELAEACGTIPYEIFTGIGQRVKRIYIED
jgi:alanine racemase